jgi:hypothetical protein
MQKAIDELNKYAKSIQALNIGISDGKNLYVYTQFDSHPEYYNVRMYLDPNIKIITSEELYGYKFEKADTKKILSV